MINQGSTSPSTLPPFSRAVWILLLIPAALFWAPGLVAQECLSTQLASPLKSLSWPVTLDQGELLGIDGASKEVVRLETSTGRISKSSVQEVNGRATFVAFGRAGTDIVQAQGNAESLRIGWFDDQLQLKNQLTYGERALRNPDQARLLAPYRWITTQGHLVGYGAVRRGRDKSVEYGFFDQPLPMPGSDQISPTKLFHTFNNPSFYVIGHPFMVAIGSKIIYLEMGSTSTLYQYDLALGLPPQEIRGLPGEDTLLKDPKAHMLGLAGRERLMEMLDTYEGPWGLYEHSGTVYLLERQSTGSFSADWTLRQLDVDHNGYINQKIASKVIPVPSTAQQIVLVASSNPGEWLVFEQTGKGDQRAIATMISCSNLTPTSNTR